MRRHPKKSLAYKISQGIIKRQVRYIPKTLCTCKDPVPYKVLRSQVVYCLICNLALECVGGNVDAYDRRWDKES